MGRSALKSTLVALCAVLVALIGGDSRVRATACAYVIEMMTFDTAVSGAVGIDYHEPTGQLVVSVNAPSGTPNNLDFIDPLTAAHNAIPGLAGMTGEIKVATVRSGVCQGGFGVGD